jgi:hypothetical protein
MLGLQAKGSLFPFFDGYWETEMRSLAVLGLCVFVGGCGLVAAKQRQEDFARAQAQAASVFAECEAKYKNARTIYEPCPMQNTGLEPLPALRSISGFT